MRPGRHYRVVRRAKGTPRPAAPAAEPQPRPAPPRAADLDNPYGRYYGTARSWEDLKKNRNE